MIVPYAGLLLSPAIQKFNFFHSSSKMCVEQAFGRLKVRFRLLNSKLYVWDQAKLANVIPCACIFNNIVIDMNNGADQVEDEVVSTFTAPEHPVEFGTRTVRDILCQYLDRVVE